MHYLAVLALIAVLAGCQSAQDSEQTQPRCTSHCVAIVIYSENEALFERGGNSPPVSLQAPLIP